MVEAAGRVVEVLVGEKVDVDATLGIICFGNLRGGNVKVSVQVHKEEKQREAGCNKAEKRRTKIYKHGCRRT